MQHARVDCNHLGNESSTELSRRLEERGVRSGTIDARTVRFVTHTVVDDAGLDVTIDALHAIADEDGS